VFRLLMRAPLRADDLLDCTDLEVPNRRFGCQRPTRRAGHD